MMKTREKKGRKMFDFSIKKPEKCKNCKKLKGHHKYKTMECPKGMKTRIGYTQYGPEKFELKEDK